MKKNIFSACMLLSAILLFAACSSPDLATSLGSFPLDGTAMIAYVDGVPGGVLVDASEMTATVSAVNKAKRKVTLMGSDGQSITAKVGPEAINFDQIEVGDTVTVTMTQTLAIFMGDAESAATDGDAILSTGAPQGEKPGGLIAGGTQATAKVAAIDEQKRTATLEFADGSSETFPVRPDVDLSERKVGEHVVFQVATLVTIDVAAP